MKRGLVLSGGGSKGAFQVGVIEGLMEKGITFDFVSGVSVGALNATMVALQKIEDLKDIWLSLRDYRKVYKKRWLGWLSPILGYPSLYDPKPLQKLIETHVDPKALQESPITLRIGVVDLITGQYLSIPQDHPDIRSCILASTAIPLAFPPVKIGGQKGYFVDGGVRNVTPLKEAIEAGVEEIFVVLTQPEGIEEEERDYRSPLQIVLRTLDIMVHEIIANDIEVCLLKNRLEEYKKITIHLFRPPTPLYETLTFEPNLIQKAMEMGQNLVAEKHA